MGKSSSSSKKIKRSKDSSELRSVKKKKTKRSKSKKIRRVKDYSDESESSDSSSSEDDYRREKHRSKVSKKKRSRKRYSSNESDDDDDDIRLLKKKKRSKRKDERVGTKKRRKEIVSRKRRKRDSSSSSTNSDSYSIGDNQTDDGSESDGKRDKGRLGNVKDSRKRSKDESEEDSEPDECWQVEDDVMTEKNSRRLKSIVVVSYNYDNDETNKDMVDDHDGVSDENKIVDDQRDGEATISYPRSGANDNGPRTIGYDEFEEYDSSETSKASHQDNSLKDDDLEAILKKRALENLKRFRGETQKNGIARKEVSSVSEEETTLQTESEIFEESQDHKDLETSQKILQVSVKESGTGLADLASQQDQQSGDTAKVKASSGISSCTTKRKLIRPVLRQERLNMVSREGSAGCQDAESENINGKSCPESSLALATSKGGENIEPRKVSSTSSSHAETETLDENKGESQSEQKTNDDSKGESQYEKKTMTVMRGGEMVQVSYKVYIPKKTSSLGRRLLRR